MDEVYIVREKSEYGDKIIGACATLVQAQSLAFRHEERTGNARICVNHCKVEKEEADA